MRWIVTLFLLSIVGLFALFLVNYDSCGSLILIKTACTSKSQINRLRLSKLESGIYKFVSIQSRWPKELSDLTDPNYMGTEVIDGNLLHDAWGVQVSYTAPANGSPGRLFSSGPDRTLGGTDDEVVPLK